MLSLHLVPQPIDEQDCIRHICLEGQLIRVNQSQHCPQGTALPRCGVLGLPVRVGGDRCCPLWECACESWGPPGPPQASSYPYPSVTSTPGMCPWPQGNPDLKVTSLGTSHLSMTLTWQISYPVASDLCAACSERPPAPRASDSPRKTPRCLPSISGWPWPWGHLCIILIPTPGRCSIFPDLSFVTFDGSHAALFKEAIYILTQSPREMVTVHVLDCKSANLVTVPYFPF